MIVAYLINQYPQPSHTFIRREIAALEAAGLTVIRFTLRRSLGTLADPADEAERSRTLAILGQGSIRIGLAVFREILCRPGPFVRAAKLTWRFRKASNRGMIAHLAYLAEACVLRRWLADAKATHLHAHFGTNSTAVAALCRELGGPPFSFTVHGPEEFDQPIGLSLGEKARRAAFIVAISSFGRSQLCRWCEPSIWPRIHIVHCGVGSSFLFPGAATDVPVEPRFVCVGRLEPQKGQLLLLDAMARLIAEPISTDSVLPMKVHLTLIGDGSMRLRIEQRIRDLGLSDSVRLHGWMSGPQIRQEILASRAMVLPSFAEGLPVVLMEALAMGRPVIATWVAGIPELVGSGCGWLVPAGDVEALTAAMRQAISASRSELAVMGQEGRRRVIQQHDSAVEAEKLRHLFVAPVAC